MLNGRHLTRSQIAEYNSLTPLIGKTKELDIIASRIRENLRVLNRRRHTLYVVETVEVWPTLTWYAKLFFWLVGMGKNHDRFMLFKLWKMRPPMNPDAKALPFDIVDVNHLLRRKRAGMSSDTLLVYLALMQTFVYRKGEGSIPTEDESDGDE